MAQITLRVLDGADRGRVFENLETPVTIGREDGNHVQLNDERVSRYHLKIQEDNERVVVTDLESTNGTKVNGEDIQLRILRGGEMITLGRSVLWFGSKEQIAQQLASQRSGGDLRSTGSASHPGAPVSPSLEYELNWQEQGGSQASAPVPRAPELPDRLSPGQAAQLVELLDYVHVRLRHLLASAAPDPHTKRIVLDERRWQALLDMQAQLARYMREAGDPPDN
jgi:hypothetical protein